MKIQKFSAPILPQDELDRLKAKRDAEIDANPPLDRELIEEIDAEVEAKMTRALLYGSRPMGS